MNVYLAKILMYHQIQQMDRDGYSVSRISELLGINRRTVKKYLLMSEQEYEQYLTRQSERKKELILYETFVRERLELFQDTSAAQMHDWLKEHHPDFPKVNPKTVYNFVHWIRNKYNIPMVPAPRQYQVVEELPYGKQAQVDFGEYNMRTSTHSRIKVFFFSMMLSRSRYKFLWFSSHPFTAESAIQAHERAFEYFRGITQEIVYDQDKVFLVDENQGDIIMTTLFREYIRERSFQPYFCRKADPESKGKIENLIKYIKQNFLYNRTYYNDPTLNDEAMGWLGRTANSLPHGITRKVPFSEWICEQPFLKEHVPYVIKVAPETYTVRKDNTILWRSNLYSLPLGTYTGRNCQVSVHRENNELIIGDAQGKGEICRHYISVEKGVKVINTDHKRDKSAAIDELMLALCNTFDNPEAAKDWLISIQAAKPRYIRDQLLMIRQVVKTTDPVIAGKAMNFCHQNNIFSAVDYKAIVDQQLKESHAQDYENIILLNPLSGESNAAIAEPEKSSIDLYQEIIKSKGKSG